MWISGISIAYFKSIIINYPIFVALISRIKLMSMKIERRCFMKNNQKGFTLIELLVVIAIIGLLSTLAVVSLNNARQKARDSRRVSDIKSIQTALEMYYTDRNDYPVPDAANSPAGLTPTYIPTVPSNPTPNGTWYTYEVCTDDGATCGGATDVTEGYRASYTLTYNLESGIHPMVIGYNCATPAGITGGTVCAASNQPVTGGTINPTQAMD